MEYEKEGYTWMQDEPLSDLIKPERINRIKEDYLKKIENRKSRIPGGFFKDNPELDDDEQVGCASCFI
jgi:hypothetical protein